jgi:hypothetical protein
MTIVIPWLQYCRQDRAGLTLAGEWRAHQQQRVSPDERLLMDAYDSAWLSLWEVQEVEPGTGSRLTDVLTREERFVHDVSSASTLQRFDTVLAIVLTCDGISFFGGIHALSLPPRWAEDTARAARRLCRVRTRAVATEKLQDPELQRELILLWNDAVERMLDQPPPVMQNTDGDPLVLTRDDFELLAPRAELAERLESLPGVQEADQEGRDTVFVVTKAGNTMHRSWDSTIIGRIVLSETRLTLETNSTRRADALRAAVERHLPALVRFRLRREDNTEQLLAAARTSGASQRERAPEPLPPEAEAALRQFREQYMSDWLDDAIPALDGLTPREAARQPRMRSKLALLLKEIEQTEQRLPPAQRIDLRSLRDTLGLS